MHKLIRTVLGAVYLVMTLGLLGGIGYDFWLLLQKQSVATESSSEQKTRQTLIDKVRDKAEGALKHSL